MSERNPGPRYYEDFAIGDVFITPRRTVTESDVMAFAGLSGDFNPLHTDRVHAEDTAFGRPIAHGLLVLSISSGLFARLGLTDGTTIAFLGIEEWRFVAPVFFGDTIRVRATIERMRETSKPERGIVTRRMEVLNQDDSVVQQGLFTALLRRRSDDHEHPAARR